MVCHDEKLASGSNVEFLRSCREFLASTVFANNASWPTAILSDATIDGRPNPEVEVGWTSVCVLLYRTQTYCRQQDTHIACVASGNRE